MTCPRRFFLARGTRFMNIRWISRLWRLAPGHGTWRCDVWVSPFLQVPRYRHRASVVWTTRRFRPGVTAGPRLGGSDSRDRLPPNGAVAHVLCAIRSLRGCGSFGTVGPERALSFQASRRSPLAWTLSVSSSLASHAKAAMPACPAKRVLPSASSRPPTSKHITGVRPHFENRTVT